MRTRKFSDLLVVLVGVGIIGGYFLGGCSFLPTPAPPIPTDTPTPISIPESPDTPSLEQQIRRWLNGEIPVRIEDLLIGSYSKNNKPTNPVIAQIMLEDSDGIIRYPLGVIDEVDFATQSAADYQGVVLGQQVVDDYLVVIMGFTDRKGQPYTLAFNAGHLEKGLPVQADQLPRFFIGWVEGETMELISVERLSRSLSNLVNRPIHFWSEVSLGGVKPEEVDPEAREQLLPALKIGEEVYHFIFQATTAKLPSPSESIAPILNQLPPTVALEALPTLAGIRALGPWVASPKGNAP